MTVVEPSVRTNYEKPVAYKPIGQGATDPCNGSIHLVIMFQVTVQSN